jgi:hypothetical protein
MPLRLTFETDAPPLPFVVVDPDGVKVTILPSTPGVRVALRLVVPPHVPLTAETDMLVVVLPW